MDTDPRHTDERNRVDHARMETVPKLVSNDEETRQTNDPRSRCNLPSGIPGKRGWCTRGRKQLSGRASKLPYQRARKARQQWQSGTLKCLPNAVILKSSCGSCTTSRVAVSLDREGKPPKTLKDEAETKEKKRKKPGVHKKAQEYQAPKQKRNSTYDLGHISLKQFGQVVEPLLVQK